MSSKNKNTSRLPEELKKHFWDVEFNELSFEKYPRFETLSTRPFIEDFYLAGGTCLALQIGHRRSIDFDFFIPADFDTSLIVDKLTEIGSYQRESEERNTINGSLNGVRISFSGYRYGIIDEFKIFNNIRLAGLKDIASWGFFC